VRDKRKLTEELIKHLPDSENCKVDDVYSVWWYNLRNSGGMRLTPAGYDVFCNQLELEHWSYPLEPLDVDTRLVLALDRKLQNPYYIKVNKKMALEIVFFDSKEAVLASLYGNIKRFIDRYSIE
jgi:hypothetical protein